ncbi:MAG: helicase, partial [Bacilli bacterium]
MGTMEQERLEEQHRVQHIVGEIDLRIDALQEHVNDKKANIVDIRKSFWDDVRVNLDDHIEAAETMRSIKQQADLLSEKERSFEHAQKQLAILTRLKQSPYFGRIDFVEEGKYQSESIYVGIASLIDESDLHFLVYDWRAPVSSLYYDYPPGPAGYVTPSGPISGMMELKRQYIVRDGLLHSMFDTGVTIGDEILQEVLGKQADAQMKSIVATIQKEQNR